MVLKLLTDSRVEASIRRLRSMGLNVKVSAPSNNEVLLTISVDSIMNYIIRKMLKAITFPNKDIFHDVETQTLVIYMWRGKPRRQVSNAVTSSEEMTEEEEEEEVENEIEVETDEQQ